jgi:peptide/nickel transport system substrate-binding protein
MKRFIIQAAVFTAAVLVSAPLPDRSAQAATPEDVLVMGWTMAIYRTLDPADIGETYVDEVLNNVCDPLLFQHHEDPTELLPGIAESWEVSEDATTYTFNIRPGLTFPSGNPVTAHDTAWTIHRNVELNLNSSIRHKEWGFTAENVRQRVVAKDDLTLVVTLDAPAAPNLFLTQVFTGIPGFTLDRAEIMKHETNGDWGNAWLSKTSACIGPYKVVNWTPNDVLVLRENEGYWRHDPYIRQVVIRHIPEGGTQRLLLEKGDIDVARNITSSDLEAIEANWSSPGFVDGYTLADSSRSAWLLS